MLVLNPMGGSNLRVIQANGLKDYDVNYTFASFLGRYLRSHGEDVVLTRDTSEARDQMALDRFLTMTAPDIIINIKCLEDISSEPNGYTVECDHYSALAATISVEVNKWGVKPVYPLGYKIQTKRTQARYTEITLGLGYITNVDDASRLGDLGKLEALAKSITDAAYGPPTKVMQPKDDVYISDPYMYDQTKWLEGSVKSLGDTGGIVDSKIENIPVKVLRFQTVDDGRVEPYTFSTGVTVTDWSKDYLVIVSIRCPKHGSKGYISVGSTTMYPSYTDDAWHKYYFDYSEGDTIRLGAYGNASIEYTGLWVTPKGSIGTVDDPVTQYSIFPPGYRPIASIDPTAVDKSLIQAVITQANSLVGRAQDTTVPDTNSGIHETLSKVDQVSISSKTFVRGIQGIANQLKHLGLTNINVVDPSGIKAGIDYGPLQNMVKSMARGDKRASMLKAINDIKGVEQAAKQLTLTFADKERLAKERAERVNKRLQSKGEAMSKP